jgi:hypothetical protein
MLTGANKELMPETVESDGVLYSIVDMRSGEHPVIRLMDCATQRALLSHPSTQPFITHCGVMSIFETLYAGVPVLGLPGFGDQPNNANKLAYNGVGLELRKSATSENTLGSALYRLLSPNPNEASSFRANAIRLQQMIRIANRNHGRGADLIELAAIPGAILAHESADWRMPWWQAKNYDLDSFILVSFVACGYLALYSLQYLVKQLHYLDGRKKLE